MIPLGTLISTLSPNSLPNSPLPIGEFTDNFPFLISDSESATRVYENYIPLVMFLILILE